MAMIYIDHEIYLTILTGFHYLLTMECFVPYFGFISLGNYIHVVPVVVKNAPRTYLL